MNGLTAHGLSIQFGGQAALSAIDLYVDAGTSVALSGPSGSGKSVLLYALAGLVPATEGEVRLDGVLVAPAVERGGDEFGLILQSSGLAAGLTAEENIALPLQERGLERREVAARCVRWLEAVGLAEAAARLIDDLSGGQRQRVGVARGLAGEPRVLLADEPTAELDSANRARILALLLQATPARIVVIASNDPEIVRACDRVVHLRDGRIIDPSSF